MLSLHKQSCRRLPGKCAFKRRRVASLARPLFVPSGAIWEPRCASTLNSPSDLIDRRHRRRLFDYSLCLYPGFLREGGVDFLKFLISQLFFPLFASFNFKLRFLLAFNTGTFHSWLSGANFPGLSWSRRARVLIF